MEKNLKKIKEFLNVSEGDLLAQQPDLIEEMIKATNDDDMFKVHQLGYLIKSSI